LDHKLITNCLGFGDNNAPEKTAEHACLNVLENIPYLMHTLEHLWVKSLVMAKKSRGIEEKKNSLRKGCKDGRRGFKIIQFGGGWERESRLKKPVKGKKIVSFLATP